MKELIINEVLASMSCTLDVIAKIDLDEQNLYVISVSDLKEE